MNSNHGRSFNNFDFDLGINSNRSKSLNGQKNNKPTSYYSSLQPKPDTTSSWQPNMPSWAHQRAPSQPGSLNGPTSMVGDITGRSWASSAPQASGVGIVNKNPNLFSDLVDPSLGQSKGGGNVPLKNAAPIPLHSANKSAYLMGTMADSLPKAGISVNSGGNWSSDSQNFGSYNSSNYNTKNQNLGGPSMRNSSGGGIGSGTGSNKDPFGSLVDFSSKIGASLRTVNKESNQTKPSDKIFGDFHDASKRATSAFSTSTNSMSSNFNAYSKLDDFGVDLHKPPPTQPPHVPSSGIDAFDVLFASSSGSASNSANESGQIGNQQFSGDEDWGFDSGFEGGNDTNGTTELEGLPPPPAGVTGSSAKNKGMDNYKNGQYPDAIKWLSWAVILLEKDGDNAATLEVLSSRASCYKEVGEYKKAVTDCTKVLEQDGANVSVLVQRALLYESLEKYRLGAEDLRTVMRLDPGNRVARSTIHRLTKMAD